ncbi:MAG TPA: hypothetical protein DET40_15400 [Lentisphaeria bacterium]|nr:MAG: hypothetical protein A2X45_05370 [Lentisphaerae bacterium GWF2_50_93]HCE44925.1 hypothetical protein [Lentisphaeria bacterium]
MNKNNETKEEVQEGFVLICAWCRRITDGKGRWHHEVKPLAQVEFTHGICPECARKFYDEFDAFKNYIGLEPITQGVSRENKSRTLD